MAKESSHRVAVFPGNNHVLFEGDRGAVDFEAFAEIFFTIDAIRSQIFRHLGHGNREIGSANGAKTG